MAIVRLVVHAFVFPIAFTFLLYDILMAHRPPENMARRAALDAGIMRQASLWSIMVFEVLV